MKTREEIQLLQHNHYVVTVLLASFTLLGQKINATKLAINEATLPLSSVKGAFPPTAHMCTCNKYDYFLVVLGELQ